MTQGQGMSCSIISNTPQWHHAGLLWIELKLVAVTLRLCVSEQEERLRCRTSLASLSNTSDLIMGWATSPDESERFSVFSSIYFLKGTLWRNYPHLVLKMCITATLACSPDGTTVATVGQKALITLKKPSGGSWNFTQRGSLFYKY